MLQTLKQELIATQPWIIDDLAFRVVADSYDYKGMGSSSVELESPQFRLRFVRDWKAVCAMVAPLVGETEWCELSYFLEAVRGERPACGSDLKAAAFLFRNNLPLLTEAMGPGWPETKKSIARLYEERVRESRIRRPVSLFARLRPGWRRKLPLLGIAVGAAIVVWIVSR